MNQWICEDVGLVIDEIREKLDKKIKMYEQLSEETYNEFDDELNTTYYDIVTGLDLASDIIEEVADNWTSENPPAEILNKVKDKYK